MSNALAKGLSMTDSLSMRIEISNEDQYDFIMRTFSHIYGTLLVQQAALNDKFIFDTENANRAFDSMRKAINDAWSSIALSTSNDESRTNA